MKLIDVHAHWLPPAYLAAMASAGIHDVDGFPMPDWSEHGHLAVMDRQGIASSILSISAPGIGFVTGAAARDLARRVNEEAAALRDRSAGRFGAFALLTLPDVDGALREMEYALDTLHLDGIALLTNIDGIYLGDPRFDAVFDQADRRQAVIYTHPVAPPGFNRSILGFSGPALEYPFDTTRMILNLVATGTLRRYTRMKLIASHGGGTSAFLGWRMSMLSAMFNRLSPAMTPPEAITQMKAIYCDSTAVLNPDAMASYLSFVPPDRRLYGSDQPFMPEMSIPPSLQALRSSSVLPADAIEALEHGNAAALFPRLAHLLPATVSPPLQSARG
jgi:predicted TIM-barrel fold metal-dependent hydrolase